MVAQKLDVQRFPLIYHFGEREIGFDEAAAVRAHLETLLLGHEHDPGHGFGQRGWIGDGNEETGFAGKDRFAGSCGIGGDYGQAGCRGLEDADGKALPERGENEAVGCCEQGLDVGFESCEVNTRGDLEFHGQAA